MNSSAVDHPSSPIAVPSWAWGKGPQQELPLFVLQGLESRGISNKGIDFLITQAGTWYLTQDNKYSNPAPSSISCKLIIYSYFQNLTAYKDKSHLPIL